MLIKISFDGQPSKARCMIYDLLDLNYYDLFKNGIKKKLAFNDSSRYEVKVPSQGIYINDHEDLLGAVLALSEQYPTKDALAICTNHYQQKSC